MYLDIAVIAKTEEGGGREREQKSIDSCIRIRENNRLLADNNVNFKTTIQ